ncbi:hypothetical protein [Demequina sp.]|uniref:hypothetical protein n=1 Tax=Demequina sp. TaxID=2050685 RepID=UPI0025C6651D|nr:hypothetical protein [Demequina sp.]
MMMRSHAPRDVVTVEVRRTLTKRRFWLATLLVPCLVVVVSAILHRLGKLIRRR